MKHAYLVLANGQVFEGYRIGADGDALGELVFHTGVVGYVETLTDPGFSGQIVMQTFPLIGNYGVAEEDFDGISAARGYVVRECCDKPSNFRSEYDLDTFLKTRGIVGIAGVDTRELTRILREEGVMNACICDNIPENIGDIAAYTVTGAVAQVSGKTANTFPATGEKRFSVTVIDYGVKRQLIRGLCARGCEVTVVPHDTSAAAILAASPDGVMLSSGPGDPAENTACIAELQKLIGHVPLCGIGLGHQLVALAQGGRTVKLSQGHRGGNQPVKEVHGTRTYITAQNHGYVVLADSLAGVGECTFVNANDGSCEGMTYAGKRCFTVQFDPDTAAGPQSTAFVYDRFIEMMGGNDDAVR